MMVMKFSLCLAALCALAGMALAQENPFLGKWDITGVGPNANVVYWLEVKQENGKLTANFLNRGGSVLPVSEIRIEGNELVFSPALPRPNAPKPVHRAHVEDGRLLGRGRTGHGRVKAGLQRCERLCGELRRLVEHLGSSGRNPSAKEGGGKSDRIQAHGADHSFLCANGDVALRQSGGKRKGPPGLPDGPDLGNSR